MPLKEEFITYVSQEEEAHHMWPHGEASGLVKRQKGARGKPKSEPLLGFLQERQAIAGKIA